MDRLVQKCHSFIPAHKKSSYPPCSKDAVTQIERTLPFPKQGLDCQVGCVAHFPPLDQSAASQ